MWACTAWAATIPTTPSNGRWLQEQNWHALSGIGWELIAAFFLGGALLACIMTPLCYYGIRFLVIRHREKLARKARDNVSGQDVRPAPEERRADKG